MKHWNTNNVSKFFVFKIQKQMYTVYKFLLFIIIIIFSFTDLSFSASKEIIFQPSPGLNNGGDDGSINAGKDSFFYNCSGGWSGTMNLIEGYARSTCNACSAKAYIKFNIDTLPDQVESVFFGVTHLPHTNYCYSMCDADFYFFPVLSYWNEVELPNTPPAEGDSYFGPIRIRFPNNFGAKEYDTTSIYRLWKNKSILNNGIVVYSNATGCNNASVRCMVYSSDDDVVSRRPYLKVKYTISSLKVVIEPSNVLSLGAKWRIKGTQDWRNSGETDSEVALGLQTVEFKPVPGWGLPITTNVVVEPDVTNMLTAKYRADSGLRFNGLKGQVEIANKDEEGSYSLAKMDSVLYEGDFIRTDEDSKALISDGNDNFILPPESTIRIKIFEEQRKELELPRGKIWINIKNMILNNSMDIEMNQCVASIKGTTLVCERTSSIESNVKVIEGTVDAKSLVPLMTTKVQGGKKVTVTTNIGISQLVDFDVTTESSYWSKIRGELTLKPSFELLLLND